MNAVHDAFTDALRVISGDAREEADRLAADRARNVNKAERAVERNAEYALRLQQRYEDAMDAANNYGSGRGTL